MKGRCFFAAIAAAVMSVCSFADADPLQMSVVRNGGPKKPSDYVPEDVRLTAEEMKAIYAARAAEWASLGYKQTYPKDWKKRDFSVDGPKMRAAHPEFFGLTLSGERKVSLPDWPKWFEGLTKWCVSNDALVDAILDKWRKAGRPYLLRFYENDGLLGFCRCEKCCALDADLPGENFLDHKTDRYLSLFNRVAAKARAERPDVSVVTFFYSVYRFPPRREKVAFPDNQVCILIPSLIDDVPAYLEGWRKAGMKRFGVRPNYLCHYMPIPRGVEKRLYDEHRLFRDAGSIGMEWDASTGTAANDFDFYVAVRLAAHPDLTFAEIEDGWYARFGAARATVRDYYRRVRARCDRSWPELIRYFRENHLDFLDDGHLSCYTPRLHTEAALEEDVALLKQFDTSSLEGEAKTRFDDLVFMAEHALATWKANVTKSKADKAALHAMRVKNRLKLGDGTRKWYKVSEALLWDDTPRNRVYYQDFAVPRLADAYERIHSVPPIAYVGNGMKATADSKILPEGLRYTEEEAAAIAKRRADEAAALGYTGSRMTRPYHSGHYFTHWRKGKVWDEHRDFFGLTPYGTRGVEMGNCFPSFVKYATKVCVSNDGAVDQRIDDWKKEGCPWLLIAGETDSLLGYCRCEKCRALDADLPGESFLNNKTDRYLDFWNRIAAKARAIRPDVKVCVFLYAAQRHPPRRVRVAHPENMLFSYVPTFHERDIAADVAGWKRMGMQNFYMRPNYLCNYTVFPIAREKYVYDAHRVFREAGGKGDYVGGTRGCAAMGFEFYTVLRMNVEPDVPFAKIESEWYAKYGAAADVVRRYHERLRARCDERWDRLLSWMEKNDIYFIDDGHFSRCYYRFHDVDELEGDLALLESFDDSALSGEAKERFANLKLCAKHYIITRKTLETKTEADKKALVDFRVAHRDALGTSWSDMWNKGEIGLWNNSLEKRAYMDLGISTYVEAIEQGMAKKTSKQLIKELPSPLDRQP